MSSIVRLEKVSARIGAVDILKAVDLSVAPGERIVLIGPSGSGKSSLLRLVCGLLPAASGTLYLFGEPVSGDMRRLRAARRRIGFIFQQFNLYGMKTALENVMLAPRLHGACSHEEARGAAMAMLARVGVAGFEDRFPFELSGGQQQRVAIARALVMKPDVLLLDEPTASLDPELVRDMLDLIVAVASDGMTVLCATHELGFARRLADRVVFMESGRMVAEGAPNTLLDSPPTERLSAFLNAMRESP